MPGTRRGVTVRSHCIKAGMAITALLLLGGCTRWWMPWHDYPSPPKVYEIPSLRGTSVIDSFSKNLDAHVAGAAVVYTPPGSMPLSLILGEFYNSAGQDTCRTGAPANPGPIFVFCRTQQGWRALDPIIDNSAGFQP